MKNRQFYTFLHQQILVMLGLTLGPGLGYVILGLVYDAAIPAASWYVGLILLAIWGYQLYRKFSFDDMTQASLAQWYQQATILYYLIFVMCTVIFVLMVPRT